MGLRVQGRLTELRPATEADVDRLVAWHADPEVGRYWDWETFTPDEMRERLSREDVDAWIVEAEAEPIGYLQVHPEGLDMFLVPGARGRGLGPDAARAMTEHLLAQGRARVTVDPTSGTSRRSARGCAPASSRCRAVIRRTMTTSRSGC